MEEDGHSHVDHLGVNVIWYVNPPLDLELY
jgi:hypothetical protein